MRRIALVALSVLLISACGNNKYRDKYDKIVEAEGSIQIGKFQDLSLGDQYEVMQYANSDLEPPDLGLIDQFSKNGAEAIPLIREKLRDGESGIRLRNIAEVILKMQELGYFQSAKDKELMRDLVSASARDKSQWASMTKEIITEIGKR